MSRRSKTGCPICGAARAEKYAPFCSVKCADRDLANWLSGNYAIPAADDDEDTQDESEVIEAIDSRDSNGSKRIH